MGILFHRSIKILLPLLLLVGVAQASDWVAVDNIVGKQGGVFVDESSIRITGNVRRAWFKIIFPPHSMKGKDSSAYWSYAIFRDAFNCSAETSRTEDMTVYFEDGDTKPEPSADLPWKPVTPDSVKDSQMKVICAWKPK